jgi:hypothetical protein
MMSMHSGQDDTQLDALRADVAAVEVAMREAAQEAVVLHQRLGLPLVEWHEGQIVLVSPDQLPAVSASPQ